MNVYNKVLTGEGIYSVRAAGTGLLDSSGCWWALTSFVLTKEFSNSLAYMRSKVRMGQRLAITFEQFDS